MFISSKQKFISGMEVKSAEIVLLAILVVIRLKLVYKKKCMECMRGKNVKPN